MQWFHIDIMGHMEAKVSRTQENHNVALVVVYLVTNLKY